MFRISASQQLYIFSINGYYLSLICHQFISDRPVNLCLAGQQPPDVGAAKMKHMHHMKTAHCHMIRSIDVATRGCVDDDQGFIMHEALRTQLL